MATNQKPTMFTNFDGQKSFSLQNSRQHAAVANVSDGMKGADLDWTVSKRPLYDQDGNETGLHGIFRNDNQAFLGSAKDRYHTIQNHTAFGILTPAIEAGKLMIGRAGYIDGGRRVFMQADVIGGVKEVVKGDEVHCRILIASSHDGSLRLIAKSNPTRVICQNTLAAAIKGAGAEIVIKHTARAHDQAEKAGEIIAMALANHAAACLAFSNMAKTKMSGEQVEAYFKEVMGGRGIKDQAGEVGEAEKEFRAIASLMKMYEESPVKAKSGTVWGAYNAVTEWIDHGRTMKDNSQVTGAILDGPFMELKQRAFDLAVKL